MLDMRVIISSAFSLICSKHLYSVHLSAGGMLFNNACVI